MDEASRLERRKATEVAHALLAVCPAERRRHEDMARAYAKIITVLARAA